jgi:hypothetical protein
VVTAAKINSAHKTPRANKFDRRNFVPRRSMPTLPAIEHGAKRIPA